MVVVVDTGLEDKAFGVDKQSVGDTELQDMVDKLEGDIGQGAEAAVVCMGNWEDKERHNPEPDLAVAPQAKVVGNTQFGTPDSPDCLLQEK